MPVDEIMLESLLGQLEFRCMMFELDINYHEARLSERRIDTESISRDFATHRARYMREFRIQGQV